MPTKYTVTVSYMGTSSVIAIPKPVCDGFGIQKGDKLDLIVRDDGLYIPIKEHNLIEAPLEDVRPSPTMVAETVRTSIARGHQSRNAKKNEKEEVTQA